MRGILDDGGYAEEEARVHAALTTLGQPHWKEYLAAWGRT
jgi:hypothetical protein